MNQGSATNHSLVINFSGIFFDQGRNFWHIRSLENEKKEFTLSKRCSIKKVFNPPLPARPGGAVFISKPTVQTNSCKAF